MLKLVGRIIPQSGGNELQERTLWFIPVAYNFSASFRKGLNKSMGIGNTVVELFSAAI